MVKILLIFILTSCHQNKTEEKVIYYTRECQEVKNLLDSNDESRILLYSDSFRKMITNKCGEEIYD